MQTESKSQLSFGDLTRLLPIVLLALGSTSPSAQVHRPPQLPPRCEDGAYVESLIQRYHALAQTDAVVETHRARAKVYYYLSHLALDGMIENQERAVAVLQQRADDARRLGQDNRVPGLEKQLEPVRRVLDAFVAARAGAATPDQLALVGNELGIQHTAYPLFQQADGTLRPDAEQAQVRYRGKPWPERDAPLVVYSSDLSTSLYRPRGAGSAGSLQAVVTMAERYDARTPALPEAELASLVELAREASKCMKLIAEHKLAEAQQIYDSRWAWVMAWGDDDAPAAEPKVGLPRPPALPPRGDDPRYVYDVMDQYKALCGKRRWSLEWARAQARVSWYAKWAKIHDRAARVRMQIVDLEKEIAHLESLGMADEAARKEGLVAENRAWLTDLETALGGGDVERLISRRDLTSELDQVILSIPNANGTWREEQFKHSTYGMPPHESLVVLGFYARAGAAHDVVTAIQRLKATQTWVLGAQPGASEADRESLAEYSREAGRCIELLRAGRVAEVDRIFEQRWQWILDWGNDDAFAGGKADDLEPLLIPTPKHPIDDATLQSIKKRQKQVGRKDIIERQRIDLQASLARAYQLARGTKPEGTLTYDDLRATFQAAWGVAWEDVRTGGKRDRVNAHLEKVESLLSRWLANAKQDTVGGRPAAKALLADVKQARTQYAAGEYDAVMGHLAAIRAWILPGSGFELH